MFSPLLRLRQRPLALLLPLLAAPLIPVPLTACGPSFYAAAPALIAGELPLSVKTLAELYDRTVTPAPSPDQAAATTEDRITAAETAMKLPAAEARARLDTLLAENRKSGWQPAIANLLWDLRDTLDSTAEPAANTGPNARPTAVPTVSPDLQAATTQWIAWRLNRVVSNSVTTIQRPIVLNAARLWKGEGEAREAARAQRDAEAIRELDTLRAAGMATAPPQLLPHWRVQAGAVWFRHWNFAKALEEFESVSRDFPASPRAETAAFMAMRCRIELARDAIGEWHQRQDPDAANQSPELRAAWDSYQQFSEKYGQGRFAADLPGWSGALRLIEGNWTMAFCDYIVQADIPDQPELTAGALREAERCLRLAAEHDDRGSSADGRDSAEVLAAHPRAALRFVYHLLEPAAAVDFEQWPWTSEARSRTETVEFRRHTRWRIREQFRTLLPYLAWELEKAPESTTDAGGWDPFALAVIAWAACEDGEYDRVLTLCRHYPAQLAAGDDLQMVRAITLQRMGRPAEAVRAWNELSAAFPQSPLREQAQQRIARCLMEAGHPASALAILPPPLDYNALAASMANPVETQASAPAVKPQTTAKTADEIRLEGELLAAREGINGSLSDQWRDVLAMATPLESLQKLFLSGQRAGAPPWFGRIIASRMAGRGEFVLAREFLTGPDPIAPVDRSLEGNGDAAQLPGPLQPTAAEWEAAFAPAVKALQAAREAPAETPRAEAWLAAGDEVAALRADWSMAFAGGGYMNSAWRQQEIRVRRNARTLGYSADAVTDELLRQDPLTFASECWAAAVDAAPGSAAAARALFRRNEALRLRAECSPFAAAVADERDWTAESAKLVAALQALRPFSPEAATLADAAVPWQFRDVPWLPGNLQQAYADDEVTKALIPVTAAEAAASTDLPKIGTITKAAWQTGGATAALEKLEELRALCRSAVLRDDSERLPALRMIGDLTAALKVQGLTPMQQENCLNQAAGESVDLLSHGTGWEDLGAYIALRNAEYDRYSPEYPAKWQLWMADYPNSTRMEDASFQFLRAECRRHRGWTRFSNTPWPDGPLRNSSYLIITVDHQVPPSPESAKAVKDLLEAFDHRWPQSKFEADIALLRCGAAIDSKDWPTALDQIIPLVESRDHRELHTAAALLTADLLLHLLEPEDRAALADAIRARPAALKVLARFMTSNTPGGRLLPLRDWLGLSSLRVPPPPAEDSEG